MLFFHESPAICKNLRGCNNCTNYFYWYKQNLCKCGPTNHLLVIIKLKLVGWVVLLLWKCYVAEIKCFNMHFHAVLMPACKCAQICFVLNFPWACSIEAACFIFPHVLATSISTTNPLLANYGVYCSVGCVSALLKSSSAEVAQSTFFTFYSQAKYWNNWIKLI